MSDPIRPVIEVSKNIFSKPSTLMFPEQKEEENDNYRGLHKLDIKTCISCAACQRICPNQTIEMVETKTEKGDKKMPQINWERCLFCALCEEVCPTNCLILTKDELYEACDRREFVKRPEDLR